MGLFDFLDMLGNSDRRRVARDFNAGLIISTAWTSDEGYETALIDAEGTHPVERYADKDAALAGHAKWLASSTNLVEVTKLSGLHALVAEQQITLVKTLNNE